MLLLQVIAIIFSLVVNFVEPRSPIKKTSRICTPSCKCFKNGKGTTVDCTKKGLISVPKFFPLDTVKLILRFNSIPTIGKKAFAKLPNLSQIDLRDNVIESIDDEAFVGLKKLRILRLGSNKLVEFNSKQLAPLRSLTELGLQRNKWIAIKSDAFLNTTSLERLNVSNCGLTHFSFVRSLRNSHNLCKLDLGRNDVENLTKEMFEGLRSIKGLNLFLNDNGIKNIENGTFLLIREVNSLSLSNNSNIGAYLPGALLGLHQLCGLNLSGVGLGNSPTKLNDIWKCLRPNTSADIPLMHLDISSNGFKKLQENSFKDLSQLKVLKLSNNPLTERASKGAFKGLKSLTTLDLSYCAELTSFPKFAPENGTESFTPNIRFLNLSNSPVVTLQKMDVFNGLETLHRLDLSHTFIRGLILDPLKQIQKLYLRDSCLDELASINSTMLKELHIANNQFYLNNTLYKKWNVPNLELLDIHGNKFNRMTGQDTLNFFSIFPKLKVLLMGKMALYYLPDAIFDKLPNLEQVELSYNALGNITARWFKNLKKLNRLSLRDCRISTITSNSFPSDPKFLKRLKTRLDLRNNPFNCDCSIKWLYEMIKTKEIQFWGRKADYKCNSPERYHNKLLTEFQIPEICLRDNLLIGLSVSGLLIIVTVFIGLALYSRYRWHIKYKLFKLKIWFYGSDYEELDGSKYDYDYTVHYDKDDLEWIIHTLIPELEDKRGKRLYIKDRDSIPLGYEFEHILDSINRCYKTVLCLSNSFTRNSWAHFLLNHLIDKLAKEKKNFLVCILLEEIEGENLLDTLEDILTENNYIRLPEERTEEAMEYFWTRVDEALHVPVIPHQNVQVENPPVRNMPEERMALLRDVC